MFEKGVTPEGAIPFIKGESGNPKGRPKGRDFRTIFNEILDLEAKGVVLDVAEVKQLCGELARPLTYREALAVRMMAKALSNPESKSAERVLDRAEGKPIQGIEMSGQLLTAPELTPDLIKKFKQDFDSNH